MALAKAARWRAISAGLASSSTRMRSAASRRWASSSICRRACSARCDQLSRSPACYQAYRCVSCFNRRHMLFAWLSLFWVGFTDLYVRLCSMGIWHDWRIF